VFEHRIHRDKFVAAADDLVATDSEGHVSSLCSPGPSGARGES